MESWRLRNLKENYAEELSFWRTGEQGLIGLRRRRRASRFALAESLRRRALELQLELTSTAVSPAARSRLYASLRAAIFGPGFV